MPIPAIIWGIGLLGAGVAGTTYLAGDAAQKAEPTAKWIAVGVVASALAIMVYSIKRYS